MSLTDPITLEELWNAVSKGNPYKAPGIDGICLKFYKSSWDMIKTELLQIINCMLTNGPIMAQQVQGHVVCLPKKTHPKKIEDYRPLTLLNTDYKTLARVIANRLRPILPVIIHPNQHCHPRKLCVPSSGDSEGRHCLCRSVEEAFRHSFNRL